MNEMRHEYTIFGHARHEVDRASKQLLCLENRRTQQYKTEENLQSTVSIKRKGLATILPIP